MRLVVEADPRDDPPWTEVTAAHVTGSTDGPKFVISAEVMLRGRRHVLSGPVDRVFFEDPSWSVEEIAELVVVNWWETVLTRPQFRAPEAR